MSKTNEPIKNFLAMWILTNGDRPIDDLEPARDWGNAHTFWYCLQHGLIERHADFHYHQTRYIISSKGRKYLERNR
jgi:hypothetical protein